MRVWLLCTYLLSCACFASNGAVPVVGGMDNAVLGVRKALEVRFCEDQFWSDGGDHGQLGARAFPLRIWHDGLMFLAEVKEIGAASGSDELSYSWGGMRVELWHPGHAYGSDKLSYYWGCLNAGGEAVIRGNDEHLVEKGLEETLRWILGPWAHLMEAAPRYEGSIGPIECLYPFAEASPAKAAILKEVVRLVRRELEWFRVFEEELRGGENPEGQGDYVVTIGDFNVSSDSVFVLVEQEAEVWRIKFIRPDDCKKADVLPTDYIVVDTWSMTPKARSSWVTPDFIERVRSHGVVVRIPAK